MGASSTTTYKHVYDSVEGGEVELSYTINSCSCSCTYGCYDDDLVMMIDDERYSMEISGEFKWLIQSLLDAL